MYKTTTICKFITLLLLAGYTAATPTHLFDASKSSSFSNHLFATFSEFKNTYADGSVLGGYVCKDIIEFGPGSAKVNFGCAETHATTGVWDYDGILGMGLPDPETITLRTPYFFSLCHTNTVTACIFSILLTRTGGEVQIGGYVADSIENDTLVYTPVISPCSYSKALCPYAVAYAVDIQQIRLNTPSGDQILWSVPSQFQVADTTLVTIVDTGVSCTLLPTAVRTASGAIVDVYAAVTKAVAIGAQLYVRINGFEYPMPLSECYGPNGDPNLLTLGDPFFRSNVVIHDLSSDIRRMGFARQRTGYTPSSGGVTTPRALRLSNALLHSESYHTKDVNSGVSILSLWKHENATTQITRKRASSTVDVVTYNRNVYFTSLSVGTPRQAPFLVQLDTGSALTAIFSKDPPRPPKWQIALFAVGLFVIVAGLGVGCFFFFRKNRLAFTRSSKDHEVHHHDVNKSPMTPEPEPELEP